MLAGASVFPQALSHYDLSLATIMPLLLFNCRRPKHEVIQVDCHVLPDNTGEACKYTALPSHQRIHRQWCTKASKAGVLESLAPSRTFGQLSGFMTQWFTTRMANFQSTHFPEVKLWNPPCFVYIACSSQLTRRNTAFFQETGVHKFISGFLKALTAKACST